MTIINLAQKLSENDDGFENNMFSYFRDLNESSKQFSQSSYGTIKKDNPIMTEINRKCIVGILRSLNGNRDNHRKYKKVSALVPDGYVPKMYKEKFYGYPSIWSKQLILDSINKKGYKFQPLTAIFNDEVVFFMHIDVQRAKSSPVLENMNFVTGEPDDVFAVFHEHQNKSLMQSGFSKGIICFNRRLLTSYQEVANYLVTKLTVNLNPQRNKRKPTWKTVDSNGQSIAFTKREAADYVRNNKGTGNSMLMYTDGKVIFFVNPEAKIEFPYEFVGVIWTDLSGEIEGIMKENQRHGKFIFSSKNVAQYLNAHYPVTN